MIRKKRFEFLLEATAPVAHHAGTVGNHAHLMTQKMRGPRGWEDVPIVTGDTMRHKMREASVWAMLDAAGMLGGVGALSEAALRLLFNGGMITGSAGGSVSIAKLDAIVDIVPALGLFGGCAQNQLLPGRIVVEPALLICQEAERYCQPWCVKLAREMFPLESFTDHVDEAQRVRMDATQSPVARRLLSHAAAEDVKTRLVSREAAATSGDVIAREEHKGSMMPRTFEVLVPGSLFNWATEATLTSDLDEDVFHVAIVATLGNLTVGGKAGTGHGRMRVVAANERRVGVTAPDLSPVENIMLAPQVGALFRAHVAERKSRLVEFLREVAA